METLTSIEFTYLVKLVCMYWKLLINNDAHDGWSFENDHLVDYMKGAYHT